MAVDLALPPAASRVHITDASLAAGGPTQVTRSAWTGRTGGDMAARAGTAAMSSEAVQTEQVATGRAVSGSRSQRPSAPKGTSTAGSRSEADARYRYEVVVTLLSPFRMDLSEITEEVEACLGIEPVVTRARGENSGYFVCVRWVDAAAPSSRLMPVVVERIMMGCMSTLDQPCLCEVSLKSHRLLSDGECVEAGPSGLSEVYEHSVMEQYPAGG